jgi:UDP-N-acetylmuramoyl-L-alanyl-D-glutamate--2,6-diaminopimelate ligase
MASRGRPLSALATLIDAELIGAGDTRVLDVHHDSRQVTPESLYVALVGSRSDGHDFVDAAVNSGAGAICVERPIGAGVPELVVEDTRRVLGDLAAEVHDHPSRDLDVVGVTGTNGKTTVTHYVEWLAGAAGRVTGLMGTIHTRFAGRSVPATLTTPEASDFQRLLATMRDHGVSVVAAEVSSHALELGRVRATRFAVGAFTNLSQDHLDFHGDMDGYRRAKERLFTEFEVGTAVINVDDPVGATIASSYGGDTLTVGEGGDIAAGRLAQGRHGSRFQLVTPWGTAEVETPVIGDFNVANLAVAAGCCLALGIGLDDVVSGMRSISGVPGRFEVVAGEIPFLVVVDYAHTPEGVRRAVANGRALASNRVIALVGAGGDRDRVKRTAMGQAASGADLVIVTSDNPRSEDPTAITAAVASGVDPSTEKVVEVDRRAAIELAVEAAGPGDVVLILGRGHEPTQDIGGAKIPFDDREVARAVLAGHGYPPDTTGDRGA